jgi:hypothetical protein
LAHADEIFRRNVRNKEPGWKIAKSLELDDEQVMAAVSLLRKCRRPPSAERLALVAMKDPGLDDEDIAVIFSKSVQWAAMVREHAKDFVVKEPIDDNFFPWISDDDPTPAKVWDMAREFRRNPTANRTTKVAGVRQFWWTGIKFD